MLDNIF